MKIPLGDQESLLLESPQGLPIRLKSEMGRLIPPGPWSQRTAGPRFPKPYVIRSRGDGQYVPGGVVAEAGQLVIEVHRDGEMPLKGAGGNVPQGKESLPRSVPAGKAGQGRSVRRQPCRFKRQRV